MGTLFTIIFIRKIGSLSGIAFQDHFMPVIDQQRYRKRCQRYAVFLEGSFFRNADIELILFILYLQHRLLGLHHCLPGNIRKTTV